MQTIAKFIADVRETARKRYAWPGGYRYTYTMADGALLCANCIGANLDQVIPDTREYDGSDPLQWAVVAIAAADTIEDPTNCDHCGRQLCPYTD